MLSATDQAHPEPAVTAIVPVAPVAAGVRLVGVTVNEQDVAPLWVTVNAWLATVSVPVRLEEPLLAATE
jgi:hypothetical protein